MEKIINTILTIIENPSIKKPYRDLEKCFKEAGMEYESQAIKHLLEEKFK